MTEGPLAERPCVPCTADVTPLRGASLRVLFNGLDAERWRLVDDHHLEGSFRVGDFAEAMAFLEAVGMLAEAVDHHPELDVSGGTVDVRLYTYVIDGLYETDFVLAARIDRLYRRLRADEPLEVGDVLVEGDGGG